MNNEQTNIFKKLIFPFFVMISFIITSVMLFFLTLPLALLNSGGITDNEISRLIVLSIFNAFLHLLFFLIDAAAKRKDEKKEAEQTFGILNETVLVTVSFYTFIIIIKDVTNFVALLDPLNNFIQVVLSYDLIFFTLGSLLMIYLIVNLSQCLNKVYPNTRIVVNIASVIWLVKIGNNVLLRFFIFLTALDRSQTFVTLYNIFNSIGLIYNLMLLGCALIIISKNKFPNGKLWLLLAGVQVINFITNMIFNVTNDAALRPVQSGINIILLVLKLLFVFLIIIAYLKPFKNKVENVSAIAE